MKNRAQNVPVILALFLTLNVQLSTALAQGTAFTYQGRLQNNGSPANGSYDLRFKLFLDPSGNNQAGGPVLTNGVPVTNGLFIATVDFGAGILTGSNYWLEVDVKTNGGANYMDLSPLQAVTPTPYAIFAENIASGGISAGSYGNAVAFNNSANQFNGTFTGNGAGLTNANAATLGGLSATNFWQTSGNSGASPTNGNFLGSVDLQPVEIRVGGLRGWRVEPDPRGDGAANLIGGYISNAVQQPESGGNFIGGGGYIGGVNTIYANSSGNFIGAGSANQIGPNVDNDFIGAGGLNTIQSPESVIAGGISGTINSNAIYSMIGGGNRNTIQSPESVIAGGSSITIYGNAPFSMIGGGLFNLIYGDTNNYGTGVIAGGYADTINSNSWNSFIGGGALNVIGANSDHAVIAGGNGNLATGSSVFIGGGYYNTIWPNAPYATIPGGYYNIAAGSNSFAAGTQAQANHGGAFVWADNEGAPFASTTTNQFSVRANGGVQFVTGGTGMTLDGQSVVPAGNYVYAYGGIETVASANVFQDITFSTDAQIAGWMHTPGTSQYTNVQTGLYLIQYSVQADSTTGSGTNVQARATLNSVEIPGSRSAVSFNAVTQIGAVSRSIIASANNSDVLTIQFTGSSTSVRLAGSPGAAVTIVRIQ